MTIINIHRDGSVSPPLQQDGLMVQLLNGNLLVGKFNKDNYLQLSDNYIIEPGNAIELKKELIKLINASNPELFSRHYVVHFVCPVAISQKVKWVPGPVQF